MGERAVAPLIALVRAKGLVIKYGPGASWARIKAAQLLGMLQTPEAVDVLLELLNEDPEDPDYAEVVPGALARFGPDVIEPTLAWFARAKGEFHHEALARILVDAKVRDERIFSQLTKSFELYPSLAFCAGQGGAGRC